MHTLTDAETALVLVALEDLDDQLVDSMIVLEEAGHEQHTPRFQRLITRQAEVRALIEKLS